MRACARCGAFFEGEGEHCDACAERITAASSHSNRRWNAWLIAVGSIAILPLACGSPAVLWVGLIPFALGIRGVVRLWRSTADPQREALLWPYLTAIGFGGLDLALAAASTALRFSSRG